MEKKQQIILPTACFFRWLHGPNVHIDVLRYFSMFMTWYGNIPSDEIKWMEWRLWHDMYTHCENTTIIIYGIEHSTVKNRFDTRWIKFHKPQTTDNLLRVLNMTYGIHFFNVRFRWHFPHFACAISNNPRAHTPYERTYTEINPSI